MADADRKGIPDAWGVRTRAREGGQERRNQGHKRRGTDAGEPGGGEPPRRLSGGECGGSEDGRVEHTGGGSCTGPDTSARGSAEAGDGRACTGRRGTRSGGADDERSESDGMRDAMSPEATSRANTRSVRSESAQWSRCCTVVDITEMSTSAVVIGVVGSTRRGALKAVTADVRSTLSASSALTRTPEDGVMRKPVTGEARTRRREREALTPTMNAASRTA